MGIAVSNGAKIITFQKCCEIFNLEHVFKAESVAHYWFPAKSAEMAPNRTQKALYCRKKLLCVQKVTFFKTYALACRFLCLLSIKIYNLSNRHEIILKWIHYSNVSARVRFSEIICIEKIDLCLCFKAKKIAFRWFCRKSAKGQHLELILECK